MTLDQMFDAYFAALPAGNLEDTTLSSMKIHEGHLVRHLGADIPVQRIDLDTLQGYVAKRQAEDGLRGKKLSGATIKKEIVTLRCLWNWAVTNGKIEGLFPGRLVKYPKVTEKPPFQTWQEIERQIKRGGLGIALSPSILKDFSLNGFSGKLLGCFAQNYNRFWPDHNSALAAVPH